jgi:UDP-N-acetylmuramate dehydrogenase
MENNRSLANYTNFGCGGAAQLFFMPENKDDLLNFLEINGGKQKITVIGGGTNLLIRDGGVEGVVLVTRKLRDVTFSNGSIVAECGLANAKLFNFAKGLNLGGFEFLGCIPGTVGGACRMNAGCYGSELKDILISIEVVDPVGNVRTIGASECNFGYRKNGLPENFIFLRATFDASKFTNRDESEKIFRKMLGEKLRTQPGGEKTCGSTFKNPPDVPAWKVIEQIGLRGVDFSGAMFSEKHANFLINHGKSTATNLENLIDLARHRAKDLMGIDLELEIKIIGGRDAQRG